jgi:hypothetical protein
VLEDFLDDLVEGGLVEKRFRQVVEGVADGDPDGGT